MQKCLVVALMLLVGPVVYSFAEDQAPAGPEQFIKKAAIGGMAEVQLGKLALKQASNQDVKNFGQRMVEDHTKANKQLKEVADRKGMQLPEKLDQEHQEMADHLAKLKGAEFDKAYMSHMVKDHREDVSEFQQQAKSATDTDVKAFASQTLPTLEEHLSLAERVAEKVGAPSGSGASSASR